MSVHEKLEKRCYGDPKDLANHMKSLINNKEMSDVKFIVGPTRKIIHAHRCILSTRCQVFRGMFNESRAAKDTDTPFVLQDVNPEVFMPMMEYLYTNSVTLSQKNAVDVLTMGLEYGLDGLKQLCMEYMCDNISVTTASETLQAGVAYGLEMIKDRALKFIEENTSKVFASKGYQELSEEALAFILMSDNLSCDELEVVTAVREWAAVNSVVQNKPMRVVAERVVPAIRLPLLSPKELTSIEEENKKDNLLSVESIAFAWKCHALGKGEPHNPLTRRRKGTKHRDSHHLLEMPKNEA